ncbi:pilus (MSHA type) biogenesis protein MshL [Permianibacter sp. IMCC34836]|uniref:pilus (MSHA type) biogenesis protein MshL n=1 Tax=Permianibacter fluminis TaxID=2738515 RepID=UPI0015562F55|nr:pilus (MSHA type) biogenesis protein MshL [Permianibacter fluminis]NQD37299.1 pilus (MSHA type) biogenesis protein MshL [Permianibacter fluminis]
MTATRKLSTTGYPATPPRASQLTALTGALLLSSAVLSSAVLLSACQSVPPPAREPGPVNQALKDSSARPAATPPADVVQALLPPAASVPAEPRFDLNVNNVDARQFFMGLVAGTPYNIVVRPDVTGTLSLTVRNVSVPDVMEIARDVYGYEFERRGNLFTVSSAGLQTAIIPVNYLNLSRKGQSQTRVNSGQLADAGSSSGQSGSSGGGNNGSNTSGSQATTIPSTVIETRSEADLWKELQLTLQSLIAGSEGGSVIVNPQASLAIVRALPGDLRNVHRYLSSAETHLQRQVILEAKILEVTLSDGFQAGIDWTNLSQTGGGTQETGQTGQILDIPAQQNPLNGYFTGIFTGGDFEATLQLLRTQGTVQVLSSPRVSTVNNQKAVIKVGTDEFFVTGISTTTTSGTGGATSTPNVTLSPFFSGIALDVTPQIGDSGDITLHVHPSVSEVKDQTKQIDFGSTGQLTLPLALSSIREADSIVRARSGQIIVIGGLMQDKLSQEDAGIPWLSEIPWLGKLFTQQREASAKSELVILLRPLVTSDEIWQQDIDGSRQRVDRYTGEKP